jgi:hypothetical protein
MVMTRPRSHQRAYGQFFTPDPVVACCYGLLAGALPASPRIVDPACGDGAFLRWAAEQLYGCDIDAALAGSLAAHGLPNVYHADGLAPESLEPAAFELVIGNPPYGVATQGGQLPASEVRFLLRALELARPGGYICLVLPSGVLANERLRAVRSDLLTRCAVLAVIALPRATFQSTGTSAACSILLLRNGPPPPGQQIFFALPERLDDLPELVAAYHDSPRGGEGERGREGEFEDGGWRMEDGGWRIEDGESVTGGRWSSVVGRRSSVVGRRSSKSRFTHHVSRSYWLPQGPALARRMDASFWRPDYRSLLERMGERYPLRPLGELIDRRSSLIVGDHVRQSRGEAKGPGLPYEYYQTREFMEAGYNYRAIERCDERAYRRLRYTAVHQHDILVSCAGVGGAGRGRVCLVTHRPGSSCTGDVFILRSHPLNPIFLFLFLGSRGGRYQLLRLQNGVGTVNLSADELLQVEVPLVAPAEQRDLASRYAPVAEAHDLAMAALARGDVAGFQRERARSESALAALWLSVERWLVGDGKEEAL